MRTTKATLQNEVERLRAECDRLRSEHAYAESERIRYRDECLSDAQTALDRLDIIVDLTSALADARAQLEQAANYVPPAYTRAQACRRLQARFPNARSFTKEQVLQEMGA